MSVDRQAYQALLHDLREQHRDLDAAIEALETATPRNDLQIRRLKKQKLTLKDRITHVELKLMPDIIA
ncbi:MAG: DUF465 domain-containing protein [Pseudomonadota bacterium]